MYFPLPILGQVHSWHRGATDVHPNQVMKQICVLTASASLSWSEMDLKGWLYSGSGVGWMATVRDVVTALCPGGRAITEQFRLDVTSAGHLLQPSCSSRDTQKRIPRTTYRCFMKWGDSTIPFGILCQCSSSCTAQSYSLMFRWNLLCYNLCLVLCVLVLALEWAWIQPHCAHTDNV